ncbi:MAG: hypothetical protein H7099_08800 [Gemmatimonadaceae bacterium]|nr:hypothetical protein [Gemmatimonadaceae bacterium]
MTIRVTFCGVSLFCAKPAADGTATLSAVLLPECEHSTPPYGTNNGGQLLHLDGTPAVRHFAGILVVDPTGNETHHLIGGMTISISDGASGTPDYTPVSKAFANLADAPSMGNGAALQVDASAICATVTFLTKPVPCASRELPLAGYHSAFVKMPHPAHHLDLSFDTDLTISGATPTPIAVRDGSEVFVYNFDVRTPTRDELFEVHDPHADLSIDHDFKWLYSLVTPTSGTLLDWSDGYLPAPFLRRDGPVDSASPASLFLVSVSTCWPGWIAT